MMRTTKKNGRSRMRNARMRALAMLGAATLPWVWSCKTIEGPTGPGGAAEATTPGRVVIDIVDFAFVGPDGTDVVTVSPGDTIVFVNRDVAPHTATSTSWPGTVSFDSGTLGKDESWEFVPTTAGEWVYRCDFHPSTMQGARIVVGGSGGTGQEPPLDGGDSGTTDPGGDTGTPPGDSGTGSGSGNVTGTVRIEMRNSAFFAPNGTDTITISLGQSVEFVNLDNSSHTATSSSGPSSFNSGRLREGQRYTWTPATTGTWVYLCEYHQDTMSGAVIRVVDDGGTGGGDGGGSAPGEGSGGGGSVVPIRITSSGYFGPSGSSDVTIDLGQTVEWVNEDGVTHALRSTDEPGDGTEFESGDIAPGGTYRFTPDAAGVWEYKCRYHGEERDLKITVN